MRAEVLAPAGSMESLVAAVRCGADAVYLGASRFNARASAANFSREQLEEAVRYCHVRGVKVYQTLNTTLFDDELAEVAQEIAYACAAGVDALIVQDLAVAALARRLAPEVPLHASTQLGVHNLDGVRQLQALGFTRVVLARELSAAEIQAISAETDMELEYFVHGALCMCISGQCYLSSMIGGRSGNRGMCAQPCRLAFSTGACTHALSLKDLSLIRRLAQVVRTGVCSLKIEGRMKRPEYVAAAVTACRQALEGKEPDFAALEAVFARSGFTSGYFDGRLGTHMFGTRTHTDVTSAAGVLRSLAALYKDERRCIPVDFTLVLAPKVPASLCVQDLDGNTATVWGTVPQQARTAPTTPEKAAASLQKTGGTPYTARKINCDIYEGLMLPVSQLNTLRADALAALTKLREKPKPRRCHPPADEMQVVPHVPARPQQLRVRVSGREQLTDELLALADAIILPLALAEQVGTRFLQANAAKLMVELPRAWFSKTDIVLQILQMVKFCGVTHALAGNIGALHCAQAAGFAVHGDFSLNVANSLALAEYEAMGLADMTLSLELELRRINTLGGALPRGILAYGYLPLMLTRNAPGGKPNAVLTDRLGNCFHTAPEGEAFALYNHVPLYLADRLPELAALDFLTLYLTREAPQECIALLQQYRNGGSLQGEKTRGLYYRKVL